MSDVSSSHNEDFAIWLESQVGEVAANHGCGSDRAFPAWWLQYRFEIDSDEAFNLTDTLQIGDGGIDGWFHDDEDETLYIFQAKWTGERNGKLYSRDQLDGVINGVKLLVQDYEGVLKDDKKAKLWELAKKLHFCVQNGQTIRVTFLLRGEVSENASIELSKLVENMNLGECACEAEINGLARIHETWLSDEEQDRYVEREVRLLLGSLNGNVMYYEIDGSKMDSISKAAVCTLDGKSLGELHKEREVRDRLFHRNVRFQLKGNKVNQGMKMTLRDETKQSSFWLYNNGLTIICLDFRVEEDAGQHYLIIKGPQVVNGAQTTSAISDSVAHIGPHKVSVQAKIIKALSGPTGDEQIQRIVERTNSQSVVKLADLVSNEPIHKQLQKQFAEVLNPPWFYERKRGEWRTLTMAEKSRFKAAKGYRKVDKSEIGTMMLAALGQPAASVVKKDTIWKNPEVFDRKRNSATYLLAWKLFYLFDGELKKGLPQFAEFSTKHENAVSDNDTYLARIRRATKLTKMYLLAAAWEVLVDRYSDLGAVRAAELVRRIDTYQEGGAEPTFEKVTMLVYKAFFDYLVSTDVTQLKQGLQADATFSLLKIKLDMAKRFDKGWKEGMPNI